MERNESARTWAITAALAVLMVLTRGAHVATPVSLPDASLAVFFVAGLLHARVRVFAGFCALAFAIDAWVIGVQGVSAACIGGAYAFLVPTYACLWCAGRGASRSLGRAAARLAVAAALAFFISNGSYYAFSDVVTRMTFAEYVARTWAYAVPYVGAALMYGGAALLLRAALRAWPAWRARMRTQLAR